MQRLDRTLLAGIGVLGVHQLAYAATNVLDAEPDTLVGHGHLATAWVLASLAAIGALMVSITSSLRSRRHDPLLLLPLTLLISVGFVGMEGVERWADGAAITGLVTEPVMWLGLACAPLIAAALRISLRVAVDIAFALADAQTPRDWPCSITTPFASTAVRLTPVLLRSHSVSRRGPPAR